MSTEVVAQRQCILCGEWKSDTHEFFERQRKPNGKVYIRNQCRKCHDRAKNKPKQQTGLNGHRHSTATKPVGTPDQCGSCGTTRGNIFGDVDGSTGQKHGYLCMKCYRLVRDFQGDPERMRSVLTYVEHTRPGKRVPATS